MLKNVVRGKNVSDVWYELEFKYGETWADGGFAFPCDKDGNVKLPEMSDPAKKNYKWCLLNPDKFKVFGNVAERARVWKEPDVGTCDCGETFELVDQYMGAVQCPKCGKWYNLFGQELLPPEKWGWDGTPIDPD